MYFDLSDVSLFFNFISYVCETAPRLCLRRRLSFLLSVSVVIEVTLNENHGSTLVTRSARKVAKRTDKVGKLTGSGTLRRHVTNEVIALLLDALGDRIFECLTRKILIIVICKILELKLVGSSDESLGKCGGNYRVCKLPDLTLGILECAVTVNHYLYVLAGSLKNLLLNIVYELRALSREELDLILGRLVRAEKTVSFVAARAVNGSVEDLVKTENYVSAVSLEDTLGACSGVNIAGKNILSVVKDGSGAVSEY